MPRTELETFYKDDTLLCAHPPCRPNTNGILMGTGSLGHGLSLASGIAMSNRFTKKQFNVFCIISDGDCNCGSTWEAALFAAHHNLANLYVIIDNNGLQGFGKTDTVLSMGSLVDKWNAFGFFTRQVDQGNNFACLDEAFSLIDEGDSAAPKCIIAKTIKGNGISYMENKLEWHYLPFTDALYEQALRELDISHA
jgi:transketolase